MTKVLFWTKKGELREGLEICKTRKGRRIQLKNGKIINVREDKIRMEVVE